MNGSFNGNGVGDEEEELCVLHGTSETQIHSYLTRI